MSAYTPEVYISEEKIRERVKALGQEITQAYEGRELVVICILKGAFVFCSDLVRNIESPVIMEFMQVSSYAGGKTSSGECKLLLDLACAVEGKDLLIVEDIVDTGLTLNYLINLLKSRNPSSIKLASMLYKPARNIHEVTIDYLGFEVEDKFVVGYGLDYDGLYRELPFVGILNSNQ